MGLFARLLVHAATASHGSRRITAFRAARQQLTFRCLFYESTTAVLPSTVHMMLGGNVVRGFAASSSGAKASSTWGRAPPVSMRTVIVVMMIGAGGLTAVESYKDQKVKKVMQSSQQTVGKAAVGGPFSLTNQDGRRFTERDLLGEFTLIYFGFTHCPDICPDELEKLATAIDKVDSETGVKIRPLFISVDPERDTPERVKKYIGEFHPRMEGLTGTVDEVKAASKAYRVYFSKTGEEADGDDYLVDHSIIHYLLNPEGEFVTFYGKSFTADGLATSMIEHAAAWQKEHPEYLAGKPIKVPATVAAGQSSKR